MLQRLVCPLARSTVLVVFVVLALVAPAHAASFLQYAIPDVWGSGADVWTHSQVQVLAVTSEGLSSSGGSTYQTDLYQDLTPYSPGTITHLDEAPLMQTGATNPQDGMTLVSSEPDDGWSMQSTNFLDFSDPNGTDSWSASFTGFGKTADLQLSDGTTTAYVDRLFYSGDIRLGVGFYDPNGPPPGTLLGTLVLTPSFTTAGNNNLPDNGFTNIAFTIEEAGGNGPVSLLSLSQYSISIYQGGVLQLDLDFSAELPAGIDPTFEARVDGVFLPATETIAVPEPDGLVLLLVLAGVAPLCRRRRRRMA